MEKLIRKLQQLFAPHYRRRRIRSSLVLSLHRSAALVVLLDCRGLSCRQAHHVEIFPSVYSGLVRVLKQLSACLPRIESVGRQVALLSTCCSVEARNRIPWSPLA